MHGHSIISCTGRKDTCIDEAVIDCLLQTCRGARDGWHAPQVPLHFRSVGMTIEICSHPRESGPGSNYQATQNVSEAQYRPCQQRQWRGGRGGGGHLGAHEVVTVGVGNDGRRVLASKLGQVRIQRELVVQNFCIKYRPLSDHRHCRYATSHMICFDTSSATLIYNGYHQQKRSQHR